MKVGQDCIGLGVGTLITDGAGRILLLRRARGLDPTRSSLGLWSNPGGEVAFGETVEQAARREAREEIGVEIELLQTIGFSDQILPTAGLHWHLVTFLARIRSGEPRIQEPEKFEAMEWFALEALPEDCGLHHVIVPLAQLGWLSESEVERRRASTPES